jgi:hypothetical protein
MIFSPILNFTEPKKHSTITKRSGTGTVQLDPQSKTLYIKTGSELITTKYLGTALHSGDSIRYTLFNDILFIEKIPLPDQTDRSDCFIKQQPTDLNKIVHQIDFLLNEISQTDFSEKIRQDAISILKSLAALSDKIDPELIQDVKLILQTNGELDTDSTKKLKDLLLQIKQVISNNSPFLSKFVELPIQNLQEDIYNFDTLEDLLRSIQLSKDIFSETEATAKANDYQYFRVFHCADKTIAAMISTEELLQELKSLISDFASPQMQSVPVSSLQTIIKCRNQLNLHLLNEMDALLAKMQSGSTPKRAGSESAQHSTLTQWLLTTIDHPSILPELVNRYPSTVTSIISALEENAPFFPAIGNFGITEELLNTIKRKEDLIPMTIKRLGFNVEHKLSESAFDLSENNSLKVIILNKIIESATNSASPSGSVLTDIPKELSLFLDNVYNELSVILKNLSECNQSDPEIKRIIQSLYDSLSKIDLFRIDYLQPDLQIKGTDKENGYNVPENLNDKLIGLWSDLVNNIRFLQNSFQITGERSSPDLFDYLFNFGQKLSKFIENYRVDSRDFSNQQIMKDTTENDHLPKPHSTESAMFKDSVVSNHLTKPFLDSLLNRLESLQLLSRPVSTSDGTQQVLALPMNVGGEWMEVNIRLVRKKNSSKKKVNKSFYKVELNVAPSKLGAINVRMDYELKKRFDLRISFDRNQTLEWFSKNRSPFGKSLCNLGLPLVDFQLQSKAQKNGITEPPKLSNTTLDVKI